MSDQWVGQTQDQGEAAVYALGGSVWITFTNRTKLQLSMHPDQARWLARELLKHADECGGPAQRPKA